MAVCWNIMLNKNLCLLLVLLSINVQAQLEEFIQFDDSIIVKSNFSSMGPLSASECASECLKLSECVSFNMHGGHCELNRYSVLYAEANSSGDAYYHRRQARDDSPAHQAVPYIVQVPTGNVSLLPGSLLRRTFDANILYLLQHPLNSLLYFFRQRANVSNPGECWGWDEHLQGSIAGEFLMGSGGVARWPDPNITLVARMHDVVKGIADLQEPDGYIMAFPRNATTHRENPDYVTSWLTHGLLEAAIAGNDQALPLLRQHFNWFNNCTYLPLYLPPDDRPSAGYAYGQPDGHGIYLIYQGMIHNTRLATSPVGTVQDYKLVQDLMQEDWWLRELIARNLTAVWRRNWFPHNYEVTALEAYMDLYLLTGNHTYLDAVQGAYAMFKEHWIHLGGSMAINEPWDVAYPPSSYYLDYTDTIHNGLTLRYGVPACKGPQMYPAGSRRWRRKLKQATGHPTGELCGSMFWLKLNQRFHRIDPTNESYYTEIEREIYNVGVANQDPNGNGIRYFTLLHRNKQNPTNVGTCCEGQGTRMYGSLPEYVFSFNQSAIYVNLFAATQARFTIQGVEVDVELDTNFPYADNVTVTVTSASEVTFNLFIRVPSWAAEPVVLHPSFNIPDPSTPHQPGTYAVVSHEWTGTSTISFALPMALKAYSYTGLTQVPSYTRVGYLYGPILLAAVGVPRLNTGVVHVQATGHDALEPDTWLHRADCPQGRLGGLVTENHTLTLACQEGTISSIDFASYGTPTGTCGSGFQAGACDLTSTMDTLKAACVGKSSCSIRAINDVFKTDPCPGVFKRLAVSASGCHAAPSSQLSFLASTDASAALIPYYKIQTELFDAYPIVET